MIYREYLFNEVSFMTENNKEAFIKKTNNLFKIISEKVKSIFTNKTFKNIALTILITFIPLQLVIKN